MSMTTPRVTVPVEWHREDADHCHLIYSLMQKGWRKGQPVMVNDVAIRVEACNGSETDIGPIADAIQAALSAAPAPEGGAVPYDLSDLCQEVRRRYPSAFDGTDPISTHPPSLENATDLFLAVCFAALATREEAPACKTCGGKGYTEHEGGEGEGYPSRPEVEACSCREEAPAGAGDFGDALLAFLYRHGLKVALDVSEIEALRQSALRAQPQAREDAQPVAWRDVADVPQDGTLILLNHRTHGVVQGWFSKGEWTGDTPISPREYTGDMWILGDDLYQDEVEFGEHGVIVPSGVLGWLPLDALGATTHPAPDALREAREAVLSIKDAADSFRDCSGDEVAGQVIIRCDQALAALQAEQKGGA